MITKILSLTLLALGLQSVNAEVLTLDSCRRMALQNNKELLIRREQQRKATFQKRQAAAAFLPTLDLTGGYFYNQKNLELTYEGRLLPIHLSMEFDIHNVFFGAVTLTQPLYMGGKIIALNKIATLAEDIAGKLSAQEAQDIVYAVDGAYWSVVSLKAKHLLAESYLGLLDSLRRDVDLLHRQGLATKSDMLNVDVQFNQASVDLTKVENGLQLSRMALAQLCGLPPEAEIEPGDSGSLESLPNVGIFDNYDMDAVYAARQDISALALAEKVARLESKVKMADMLPNVALVGSYSMMNPSMFNGFRQRFEGAFSVGVMVKIPIWHWGGNYNAYQAAKTDAAVASLRLEDAREMVALQVSQASFKAQEAVKTYMATRSNLQQADENLRIATLSFREGMTTSTDVMTAQTAWLKARSENIDALIDLHLCAAYLSKVLGRS
jgi:outer membrane protein TolC